MPDVVASATSPSNAVAQSAIQAESVAIRGGGFSHSSGIQIRGAAAYAGFRTTMKSP
ncbi:MAG TPA: hypothetical protein VEK57_01800 [Thermoanaerobaculia bacterium]|nr:hypothetical protein [Thermoanaerobaculia bacterium]